MTDYIPNINKIYEDVFEKTLFFSASDLKPNAYPAYNIVKTGDNTYAIELAIAGYFKNQIDITLDGNILRVHANASIGPNNPVEYLVKGIAERSFTRAFTLADSVEVHNAEYINGILRIFLERIAPEVKSAKKIDITSEGK